MSYSHVVLPCNILALIADNAVVLLLVLILVVLLLVLILVVAVLGWLVGGKVVARAYSRRASLTERRRLSISGPALGSRGIVTATVTTGCTPASLR
jgi:autotransporter translocation and assembly factor TamB